MCCKGELIDRYFKEDTVSKIKNEIKGAYGNEVLFFGWTDEKNLVEKVEVAARGNDVSVAVPIEESFVPDVIIHNHPDGPLSPSDQDVRISSIIANRGVGFLIINNDVTDIYAVIEPVEKGGKAPIEADKLLGVVSEHGSLASSLPYFEEREGQKEMIRWVCESFNKNTLALLEAGTGIGKSIAYLIPSIEWSLVNKERVIISTNTINLQEQLLHKDIPDLKRAIQGNFSYILMKGRGNYVCLNRIYESGQDLFAFIDDEEEEQFQEILNWITKTEDGSLSDLTFIPKTSLWEKINSQTETCLGGECEYFNRCFVNRIKRRAVTANIVVTNHHYLLADASIAGTGTAILPSFDRLIFDEAHNLEDSATSFFTQSITLSRMLRVFNRLYSGGKKEKGYLLYLLRKKAPIDSEIIQRAMNDITGLKSILLKMFEEIDAFLNLINALVNHSPQSDNYTVVEVNEEVKSHPRWDSSVLKKIDIFYKECTKVASRLMEIKEYLFKEGEERLGKQIEGFISRIVVTVEILDIFLKEDDSSYVRWIEKKKEVGIVVSLIDVGSTVYELIFKRVKSSVLTSATLTVDGSFDFMKKRLSLFNTEIEKRIDSPFHYDEQMKIIIPSDVVEPGNPEYVLMLGEYILKILKRTGGKAFVLFTSYKIMNDTYSSISDELLEMGLISYKQGNDSRRNLLKNFIANIKSILFGTVSFWEGVDAPGETLQCVIITKLPFKVPTEPVTKARLEQIAQRGGNPFLEYSLPLAVIKMCQGIGRLIRNTKDRGIVAILDNRILVKSYGRTFLNSIPCSNIASGKLEDILEEVESFLSNNSLTK